jgi:uncharacterized protein DUF4440
MKWRRSAALVALIAVATTMSATFFAQQVAARDDPRAAAVTATELARFKANVDADAKTLGLLLADDLDYVHSNGEIDTKASFIESLTSGRRDYVAMVPSIQLIRFFGDLAIVRGTAKVAVTTDGKPSEFEIGYTDVYVWRADRWQMTSWRSMRFAAPPKQ